MSRCDSCYAIVTKKDKVCYVCGEKVPSYASALASRKRFSLASNVLFLASIGFTIFSLFTEHRPPLAVSVAISCSLLALKLIADRGTSQREERTPR